MAKTNNRSNNKTSTKTNTSNKSRGERGMMTPKAGFTSTRRKVEYSGKFCY